MVRKPVLQGVNKNKIRKNVLEKIQKHLNKRGNIDGQSVGSPVRRAGISYVGPSYSLSLKCGCKLPSTHRGGKYSC